MRSVCQIAITNLYLSTDFIVGYMRRLNVRAFLLTRRIHLEKKKIAHTDSLECPFYARALSVGRDLLRGCFIACK